MNFHKATGGAVGVFVNPTFHSTPAECCAVCVFCLLFHVVCVNLICVGYPTQTRFLVEY